MEGQSLYISGYNNQECEYSTDKQVQKSSEHFAIESFLDFPNEDDDIVMNDAFFDNVTGGGTGSGTSTDSSNFTAIDSCNSSSVSFNDANFHGNFSESHFSGDLCVPYEDLVDLEWLSNIVGEDSYSSEDQYPLHNLHPISGPSSNPSTFDSSSCPAQIHNSTQSICPTSPPSNSIVPAKAQRSKRSRAAPCDWSSRLVHLISPSPPTDMSSNMDNNMKPKAPSCYKKRDGNLENSEGRRCLHCASEKTPQWRTGPMGPKTLCNACGVRYKSGRLVPEYRPAASPTFVSTKHSNSHRKVLELRRQREVHGIGGGHHHHNSHYIDQQHAMFGVSEAGDYLIHHPMGLDYRHMI